MRTRKNSLKRVTVLFGLVDMKQKRLKCSIAMESKCNSDVVSDTLSSRYLIHLVSSELMGIQ